MIFVGIDAGGTASRCLVMDAEGRAVARVTGPGANLHNLGIDGTAQLILRLVQDAIGDVDRERYAHAAAAVAGLDTEASRNSLCQALREIAPTLHWRTENDALAAWKGAFGALASGVVAVAGTGSVALARHDGCEARAGGWGWMLGDEGSGYEIGRAALVAILREDDRFGQETSLRYVILRQLGLACAHDIIDHRHFHMAPADVAALAPIVLEHAGDNDAVALSIVQDAAAALIRMGRAAAEAIAPGRTWEIPFSVVGGVGSHPVFRSCIRDRAQNQELRLAWHEPEGSPVLGAVHLAREMARQQCWLG